MLDFWPLSLAIGKVYPSSLPCCKIVAVGKILHIDDPLYTSILHHFVFSHHHNLVSAERRSVLLSVCSFGCPDFSQRTAIVEEGVLAPNPRTEAHGIPVDCGDKRQ